MWKLTMSLLFVAVLIMDSIRSSHAQLITVDTETYRLNLSVHFEEPMDKCENINYGPNFVTLVNGRLEAIDYNYTSKEIVSSVDLENHNISSISPSAFNGFKNVTCLNIGWNSLTNIFENFILSFNMKSLIKLNLAHATSKINYAKSDYKISIKDITASSNVSFPSCTHLDISGNNLLDLPMYFNSSFRRVKFLYLSDNNLDSSFFDRIPKLTRHLYLERNGKKIDVAYLPKNVISLFISDNVIINTEHFQQFNKLKTLSIRNCNDIYSIMGNISQRKLVNLDISSNNLASVNYLTFQNFTSLKRISLDNNRLVSLHFLSFLSPIQHMTLARNSIIFVMEEFFKSQINLKTLNLRNNQILGIHENAFTSLSSLERLDLGGNSLMNFGGRLMDLLPRLVYLNLESNAFNTIDELELKNNTKLIDLFVQNNFFREIELDSLKHLPSNFRVHLGSKNNCTYIE